MFARNLRAILATGTAISLAFAADPASAQLVRSGDLIDAIDNGGNPGQLSVVDITPTRTDMTVQSRVVIANWNRFNVPTNTTLNIANGTTDPTATLVNRVIGSNFSEISGSINAQNVNLWLINQNGILFGDGALVNSASFFASSLDVTDSDLFDFYSGTDLAGDGSNTLTFGGSLGNTVRTNSPNVNFVTDGSLMFVSEQLNLNANFDAGSGNISFITAADVNVTFAPGSPLTYVVNAGTTVAQGQTISGSVTGNSVDFAMITAPGVTNAVLQVNALVNANTAVATDTGIRLLAAGGSPVEVSIGGTMTTSGQIDFDVSGTLAATSTISGSAIDLDVSGEARVAGLVATAGDITVAANAIFAGDLDAGGGVDIQALGRVTTGSITAGGNLSIGVLNFDNPNDDPESVTITGNVSAANIAISGRTGVVAQDLAATTGRIDLTSGGNLTAGNVTAPGDIFFDAANTSRASFGSLVSSGGRVAVNGRIPDVISITGLTQGTLISLVSLGNLTAGNVLATNGSITLRSVNGSLTTGDVTTENGAMQFLSATGITAGELSATGGSVLVNSGGAINTGGISAFSNGGPAQSVTVVSTGGGDLNLGNLAADGNVSLDTIGWITAGGVTAGDALLVGATREPVSVTFTGNIDAASVTIDSLGALVAQDILARTSTIDIDVGGTVSTGDLEADLITLLGVGAITTGGILTNQSLSIAATGGSLNVGNVAVRNAGATLSLSASGAGANVVAGDLRTNDGNILITAANAITAGVVATSLTGSSAAGTIGLHAGQNIVTDELLSGEDLLVKAAGNFVAGAITVGDDAIIGAGGSVTTGNILSTRLGSDANLPSFSGAAGVSNLSFAAETHTGSNVGITAGGALDLGDLDADGNINLNTGGSIVTGRIDAGEAFSVGALSNPTAVTFNGRISANDLFVNVLGALSFGAVNQVNAITGLNAGGAITFENAIDSLGIVGSVTAGNNNVTIRNSGDIKIFADGQVSGALVALSAGDQFINLRGSDAIVASDRWAVYSAAPTGNTFGGLDSGNTAIWNGTIDTMAPGSLSGNRYVFAFRPTLTVTSSDTSKVYGTDLTGALNGFFTVSGLQQGVSGAYLGDTLAGILSGTPLISSLGAAANADVAGSPYAMIVSQGSLLAVNGYALAFDSSGLLTITPKPITASVTVDNKTYDGNRTGTGTVTLNGVIAGDDLGTAGTTFTFADKNAGLGKTVAIAGTTLTGTDAGNYTLTVPASALADILTRLLVISADNKEKTQGAPDPVLTFQVGGEGLVAGDMISGAHAREPGEFVGDYSISQGTLDAGSNYAIQFHEGTLTITAQPFGQVPLRAQALPGDIAGVRPNSEPSLEIEGLCSEEDEASCTTSR